LEQPLICLYPIAYPEGKNDNYIYKKIVIGEFTLYDDPYLRASFAGFSMKHNKAHFSRAVLEGVAFSLRVSLTVIKDLDIEMKEVRIIGGGSKSSLWRQIVADVLGLEVKKAFIDDSSFGAALLAGVGAGVFKNFEEATKLCIRKTEIIKPNTINHEKYEKLFVLYQEIHNNLARTYQKIYEVFS